MERGVGGRFDLTDAEWERLEPLIPVPELGRRSRHLRQQLNGIMWRFRTGSPWRDVPERYGNWDTVYGRFRTWRDNQTWQALFEAVVADAQARGDVDWRTVSVDSTTNRAHQHAAGAVFTETTLETFEAALPEARGQKGVDVRDERPLTRVDLAMGVPEAIRVLTGAPSPKTRRSKRVVLHEGVVRPGSPRPTSAGPGAG